MTVIKDDDIKQELHGLFPTNIQEGIELLKYFHGQYEKEGGTDKQDTWVKNIFDQQLVKEIILNKLKFNLFIQGDNRELFLGTINDSSNISLLLANNQVFINVSLRAIENLITYI